MPYLYSNKLTLKEAEEYGVKFSEDTRAKAVKVEWWASKLYDPGPDFNIFKAFDQDGNLLQSIRTEGY